MKKRSLLLAVLILLSTAYGREVVKRNSYREFKARTSRSGAGQYKYINGSVDDSVKVLALLVEFKSDSVTNTTGTGLFGFRLDSLTPSFEDAQELKWYQTDTVYKYDNLPHNGRYFDDHLKYLQNYYSKVSSGNLKIGYEIYPNQGSKIDDQYPVAYQVRLDMARYSPGVQGKSESNLDFSIRRTTSLLRFIKDAIVTADTSAADSLSPFYGLSMDEEGTLWDIENGDSTKVFVLIFHAGTNYLTDGGGNAAAGNSPSDMSDLFISQDYFKDYYDVENDTVFKGFAKEYNDFTGIKVQEDSLNTLISEVMLCSETSNQDSLNFGINGILVNLMARQLGVPTLHNKSGFSATGKFGIMDYSGYSAGRGFIPPYPSAFVRAFMGWSKPTFLTEGSAVLTAVGQSGEAGDSESDILLVPINDQEYWLIENRQRHLSGENPFNYDTTDKVIHISSSGFDFELDKLTLDLSPASKVIKNTTNFDIGIGGSGCLVWHIDEKIIDARQELDILNSDSTYRAVALEEADGINDIGIYFVNALQQRIDDYGGAEDIFPHLTSFNGSLLKTTLDAQSAPSTSANDGGKSFISLSINPTDPNRTERYYFQKSSDGKYEKYSVFNYSNRNMTVSVSGSGTTQMITREKPLQLSNDGMFDLFYFNAYGDATSPKELITLDTLGNLCMISPQNEIISDSTAFTLVPTHYNSLGVKSDTLYVTRKVSPPAQTATQLTDQFVIPHKNGTLTFWQRAATPIATITTTLSFTTPVVSDGAQWAIGTASGHLLFGSGTDTTGITLLSVNDPINALSLYNGALGIFSAVTSSGKVILASKEAALSSMQLPVEQAKLVGPYSIVTGNLDGETEIELAITDLKQKLWILRADSTGVTFSDEYNLTNFAGYFTDTYSGYDYSDNRGTPSLDDIDGDGNLDILVPGTNGVYAFNRFGVLLDSWPALLDQREWYLRKSVVTSPLTISKNDSLMTLFSTLTGDNSTFYISKIDSVKDDPKGDNKKILYFNNDLGEPDSSLGHTASFVDTLLTLNDSTVIPSNAPGGLLDMRNAKGERPVSIVKAPFPDSIKSRYSDWPLTLGAPGTVTPIICDLDESDTVLTLASINSNGVLYQWKLPTSEFSLSKGGKMHWSGVGGGMERSFSRSMTTAVIATEKTLSDFYSYPNPAKLYKDREGSVRFRYTLGSDAEEVRLTIYTVSGIRIFDSSDLPVENGVNEFTLPNLDKFGSALYRCKLNVKFGDTEIHRFWKMALLRGTL